LSADPRALNQGIHGHAPSRILPFNFNPTAQREIEVIEDQICTVDRLSPGTDGWITRFLQFLQQVWFA
jgi:hypothetical protein